jgi:Fe-S-cluster containining protein
MYILGSGGHSMLKSNPCVSCGACCAYFRVSFPKPGPEDRANVPADLIEPLDQTRVCMKGTNRDDPRCAALKGEISVEVKCGIYDRRPAPCRRFGVQWRAEGAASISGRDFVHCNRARCHWHLPRLSKRRLTVIPSETETEAARETM